MSAIVKIYGNYVLKGKKNFDEVPSSIADKVREYILGIDPNFFDPVVEENVEEVVEPEANGEDEIDENAVPPVSNVLDGGSEEPTEEHEEEVESGDDETSEEVNE